MGVHEYCIYCIDCDHVDRYVSYRSYIIDNIDIQNRLILRNSDKSKIFRELSLILRKEY